MMGSHVARKACRKPFIQRLKFHVKQGSKKGLGKHTDYLLERLQALPASFSEN